jgi:hypothetical protein
MWSLPLDKPAGEALAWALGADTHAITHLPVVGIEVEGNAGGSVGPSAFAVLRLNDQLELRRLLDGEVGGLGASEDPVHEVRGAPVRVGSVRAAGHETPGLAKIPVSRDDRQPVPSGQLQDAGSV